MISFKKTRPERISENWHKLRGNAVPLFGYHILRDRILPLITGELQSSILYWAGRELAEELELDTYEECTHLFSELAFGNLSLSSNGRQQKVFLLESPFFADREVQKNKSTFALECGFLAETVAKIEQSQTEGDFQVLQPREKIIQVQFTILIAADAPK